MTRRERIFWLVIGVALVIGFVFLIPACNQGYEQGNDAQHQQCAGNKAAFVAISNVAEFFDAHNWLVTALFAGLVTLFTWRLWQATIDLRVSTDRLWDAGEKQRLSAEGIAKRQSDEMQKSIEVANRSATVAENALIAADRAWISVGAEIITPLVFEEDRVSIGVRFKLTNIGKSPATHVDIWAEFCPDIINAREAGRKAADRFLFGVLGFGIVLFPGEIETRESLEIEMPTNSFRQIIIDGMAKAKERGEDESEWSTAWPAIMACVTYRLAGSPKLRHTVILFEVRHINAHPGWDGSAGETGADWLKLVQTFMSGQVS